MEIVRTTSDNNGFRELVTLLDEDLNSRYGLLQAKYDKFNKIESNNTVVIAFEGNEAVGCGCFKPFNTGSVEIKRMFVRNEHRGKGIAKRILTELELWAIELGYSSSVLETGSKQHEAIAFYTGFGYSLTDNFGQYIGNSNSLCMKKALVK